MLPKQIPNLSKKLAQFETWVHKAGEWRYLPIVVFLWAFLDYFVLVLPADAIYIAAVYGCSRRVFVFAFAAIFARVAGTAIAFELAQHIPVEQMFAWADQFHLTESWENSRYFLEKFGPLSLGLTALLPFPPMQFVVVLSASAGASLLALESYLIIGLIIKCAALYFLVKSGIYVVEKAKHPDAP